MPGWGFDQLQLKMYFILFSTHLIRIFPVLEKYSKSVKALNEDTLSLLKVNELILELEVHQVYPSVTVTYSNGNLRFPDDFKFGVATSAYQIEGAWNEGNKAETTWDKMLHDTPDLVPEKKNADVACDSYHYWKQDLEMVQDLGVDFYRFSIAWTRILPTGFSNKINKDGVKYYNNLINGLLEKGIEPIVTIYHFDLPQSLQDLGGWTNPLISDWFADYARVLYTLFGDRVKTWLTINEPLMVCHYMYNSGDMAPPIVEHYVAPYVCSKNLLIAHAKAWRIYDKDFRQKQYGKVAIINNPIWIEPATESDHHLAVLARELGAGQYSHPIYSKDGGWPPMIEKMMEKYSKKMGFAKSVLPPFTDEEKELIKGTYDFYSLNYYTSYLIRAARDDEQAGFWCLTGSQELNAVLIPNPKWESTPFHEQSIFPTGIRRQIKWVTERYGNVSILISENGYPMFGRELNDNDRIRFIKNHLEQLLYSIKIDGANVIGYTFWTLMDNFEWKSGYNVKFGLYDVDFDNSNRKRTPRDSARYYASVIKHRTVHVPEYRTLKTHNDVNRSSGRVTISSFMFVVWYLYFMKLTIPILG